MKKLTLIFIIILQSVLLNGCNGNRSSSPVISISVQTGVYEQDELMNILLNYGRSYNLVFEKINDAEADKSDIERTRFLYLKQGNLVMTVFEGNEEGEFFISIYDRINNELWKQISDDLIKNLEEKWPANYHVDRYNQSTYQNR